MKSRESTGIFFLYPPKLVVKRQILTKNCEAIWQKIDIHHISVMICFVKNEEIMIQRLFGIIYILMNKGTTTASELAVRFEVSVRTIYRDIDILSQAGIPVYTQKGKHGGICITDQFVLNKMLITQEEQAQILSALISLGETKSLEEQETLKKLGEFFKTEPVQWLEIDLSDWTGARKQLYEDIRMAILTHRVISFDYYGQNRDMSRRTVEPMQLLFKEYTWYLRAWCRERQAMRTFKLLRMKRHEVLDESFVPRVWEKMDEPEGKETNREEPLVTDITLWIDKKEAYRVYELFDEDEIWQLEDGHFLVKRQYWLDEWVYSQILSFGPSAKVLAPKEVAEEMKRRINEMIKCYEG